jgi:hypothetical protein
MDVANARERGPWTRTTQLASHGSVRLDGFRLSHLRLALPTGAPGRFSQNQAHRRATLHDALLEFYFCALKLFIDANDLPVSLAAELDFADGHPNSDIDLLLPWAYRRQDLKAVA